MHDQFHHRDTNPESKLKFTVSDTLSTKSSFYQHIGSLQIRWQSRNCSYKNTQILHDWKGRIPVQNKAVLSICLSMNVWLIYIKLQTQNTQLNRLLLIWVNTATAFVWHISCWFCDLSWAIGPLNHPRRLLWYSSEAEPLIEAIQSHEATCVGAQEDLIGFSLEAVWI